MTTPLTPITAPAPGALAGKVADINKAVSNINTSQTTPTIGVSELQTPATPYNIPSPPTNTTTDNLALGTNSAASQIKTDATFALPPNPNKDALAQMLKDLQSNISGQANQESNFASDAGLYAKQKRANAISNELDQLDKSFQDKVNAIKANPEGLSTGAIQANIASATDEYNNNRANVALAYKVASGDANAAQQIVNDKTAALEKQNAASLQAYQLAAAAVNNDLTESEKLQVQANMQKQQADAKAVQDAYSTALQNASTNGAPSSVLSAIDAASRAPGATPASILAAAGTYGVDKSAQLDLQLKQAQISQANANIAKINNDIANSQPSNGLDVPPADYTDFIAGLTPQQAQAFNAVPQGDQAAIAQLVNGDALMTDLVKSRGAQGTKDINRLINEARSVDPNFSLNTNKVRYNFMQNWNNPNGKSSVTRNALNTALGHLADFKNNADALDPGTLQKLNSVKNVLSTETGDPKVLRLRTDINALATEIATAYKGGQPTETEIGDWKQTIAADFSKAQFAGVANELSQLLSSKITATRYQYSSTMGKEYPQPIIDPQKKQALIDAGVDPTIFPKENTGQSQSQFSIGNTSSPGGTLVTAPGGQLVLITD